MGDEHLPEAAAAALSERGEAFEIGCSYGVASLPDEASSGAEALQLADQRLYERKASRAAASRQSADVLLRVINERSPSLSEHISSVAELALATARRLDLPEHEVKRIGLGAELHDVGKAAIPDAILEKPGPLDDREWDFMRRHTEIGARIVGAAPALEHVADLVRSSHERADGTGYPDGLSGNQIPLGASVIAVCDAFESMVSSRRPYRDALSCHDALEELRRHAGTQFDARVVEQFCAMLARDPTAATRLSAV
jgi:two-component system, cell cycle response regulator